MSVYILTPYDAAAPWAPALSVDQYEDVTGRTMGSEKPQSDLLLIRCDKLTSGQIDTIKANGSYFVLEDGQGSACATFLSGKKSGHGVGSGDTAAQMREKLITWCRNLPLSDGANPADWYQSGDIGGAWRTTDTDTVARTGGGALVVDEQVNSLTSQWPTATDMTTAGAHVLWGGDHIHADSAISGGSQTGRFLQASIDTQLVSDGFCFVSCFSFTGTCNLSNVDAAWLDNHDEPMIQFENGTGEIVFDPLPFVAGARYVTASEYNDGQKHAYAINYDPVAGEVTYWIDGTKVRTRSAGIDDRGGWNTPAIVCGTRAGIVQKGYALVARNRSASDSELADMMTWVKG